MEALERRALVMLVAVALLTFEGIRVAPVQTWLIAVFMVGLACLAAASVLLVASISPAEYIGRWDAERGRLLFLAFALVVADILATLVIFAYSAYQVSVGLPG